MKEKGKFFGKGPRRDGKPAGQKGPGGGFKGGGFRREGGPPREGGYKPRPYGDKPAGGGFRREGGPPREGGYKPRPYGDKPAGGGFRREGGPPREGGYKPRPYGDKPAGGGFRREGGPPREGGYKPRPYGDKPAGGGFRREGGPPREGGYQPRPYGDKPAGGGYRREGGPPREGGYKPRPYGDKPAGGGYRREGGPPREGGYKPRPYGDKPAGGGFRREGGPPREGGYQPRPYGDKPAGGGYRREGGPPREGGYQPRPYGDKPAGGGYRREGGPPREGGYKPRPYGDKPAGGGFRREGGPPREGGYKPRPYGDKPAGGGYRREGGPPREGGYKPRPYGDKPAGGGFRREARPWVRRDEGERGPYRPRRDASEYERPVPAPRPAPEPDDTVYPVPRRAERAEPELRPRDPMRPRPRPSVDILREVSELETAKSAAPPEADIADDEEWLFEHPDAVDDDGDEPEEFVDEPEPSEEEDSAEDTPPGDEDLPEDGADPDDLAETPDESEEAAEEPAPAAAPATASHHAPAGPHPRMVITREDTRTPRIRLTWIFDNMVRSVEDGAEDGSTVFVFDGEERFLGSAVYNSNSRIRARIFSLGTERFDGDYIRRAIASAVERRRAHYDVASDSFRVVFSEADGLPGLIADKVGDVLVVQVQTLAVDRQRERCVAELLSHFPGSTVVVRSDSHMRGREGLEIRPEPHVRGELATPLQVTVDGVTLFTDAARGQKTGLYLDQRVNRTLMKPFCAGARVLDLFCHVGWWSMCAARWGAREVIGVDSSGTALQMARLAAQANGATCASFDEADAFDWLADKKARRGLFDVIVCDPPAFAKARVHVPDALKAYLSLNYRAMKLLSPGGVLVSCSCSQSVGADEFEAMLERAARNAGIRLQVVTRGGQPPDHPVLLGFPESEYLKCVVLRRV